MNVQGPTSAAKHKAQFTPPTDQKGKRRVRFKNRTDGGDSPGPRLKLRDANKELQGTRRLEPNDFEQVSKDLPAIISERRVVMHSYELFAKGQNTKCIRNLRKHNLFALDQADEFSKDDLSKWLERERNRLEKGIQAEYRNAQQANSEKEGVELESSDEGGEKSDTEDRFRNQVEEGTGRLEALKGQFKEKPRGVQQQHARTNRIKRRRVPKESNVTDGHPIMLKLRIPKDYREERS
ncbi:MAG: hypothetical protein Q9227_007294 [Pyrenula ochraceoflavens]